MGTEHFREEEGKWDQGDGAMWILKEYWMVKYQRKDGDPTFEVLSSLQNRQNKSDILSWDLHQKGLSITTLRLSSIGEHVFIDSPLRLIFYLYQLLRLNQSDTLFLCVFWHPS